MILRGDYINYNYHNWAISLPVTGKKALYNQRKMIKNR